MSYPWIKSPRSQTLSLCHSSHSQRQQERSNPGIGMCSANFQGLFDNSPCCSHNSYKPRLCPVPQKQLAVSSSHKCHHWTKCLCGLDIHREIPGLLEVTSLCPCTFLSTRWLFSSQISLFQLKPHLGLLPSVKLQCQIHSRQPTKGFVSGYTLQEHVSIGIWGLENQALNPGFYTYPFHTIPFPAK